MAHSHLSYKKNNLKITIPTNTNMFFVDHARLKSISQHHNNAKYLCKRSSNRFATKRSSTSVDRRISSISTKIQEAKDNLKSMIVSKKNNNIQASIFNPETQQNLTLKNIIYEQKQIYNKYHEEMSKKLETLWMKNNILVSDQKDLIIAINAMRDTIVSQQQTIERLLRQTKHDTININNLDEESDFLPRKRTFSHAREQERYSPSTALLKQSATYYF